MKYNKYKSSIIILEEQGHEFAIRKTMSIRGEARIETGNGKGAIRVSVQNLMPPDKCGRPFVLCFFGRAGEATIHTKLGNLVLNRFGNGETYFRFNPCNVDGCGHELTNFLYVVVAALPQKNTTQPMKPVLTGSLNFADASAEKKSVHKGTAGKSREGKVGCEQSHEDVENDSCEHSGKGVERGCCVHPAGDLESGCCSQSQVDADAGKCEQAHEEIKIDVCEPQDKNMEIDDCVCTQGDEQTDGCEQSHDSEKSQENMQSKCDEDMVEDDRLCGDMHTGGAATQRILPEELIQRATTTYNCYYNRLIMEKCEKLYLVMQRNRDLWQNRILPFEDDKLKAAWYKVDNYRLLPIISDGAEDACIKYKHFIFGFGDSRYYIGIPGRFIKEEQPESGQSGFTYWQPIGTFGRAELGKGGQSILAQSINPTQRDQSVSMQLAILTQGRQPTSNQAPNVMHAAQRYGYWITAINTETGDILDAAPN